MFNYGFTGGLITIVLGFFLLYNISPLADFLTKVLLFVGLNPRCGAAMALAVLMMAFFVSGFVIGVIVFLIKRNKPV